MEYYEVWLEGYAATVDSGFATYCGTYYAKSFVDAVQMWVNEDKKRVKYFDSNHLNYWGCKFFDNETDARKNYG